MSSRNRQLQIPANLDLDDLLKDRPAEGSKGIKADYLAYICSTLINLKALYRIDALKDNGLVKLNARILSRHVCSYRPCLDYLEKTGVIVSDHCYFVSIESTGYDFTESYLGNGFKEYEIRSAQFKRTLARHAEKERQKAKKTVRPVGHLVGFFDKGLQLDYKGASEWIEKSRKIHLAELEDRCPVKEWKPYYLAKINERHDLYYLSLERLKSGQFNCSVDESGYRFHSGLTNLKSELRNFITYNGSELVSVDIKNSQPYFSLILLNPSFYTCSRDKNILTLKGFHPQLYKHLRNSTAWLQLKAIAKNNSSLVIKDATTKNYEKVVLAGVLYESIAEFIRSDTGGKKSYTRDQAKGQTMPLLFGDPKSHKIKHLDAFKSFNRHYPEVGRLFELFKSRPVDNSEATHYNDFAILLQRIESHMVLNVITKKFHQVFPNAPLFTVHDCIVTDLEHKDQLAEMINTELTKVMGAPPTVKFENWTHENATVEIDEDLYRF